MGPQDIQLFLHKVRKHSVLGIVQYLSKACYQCLVRCIWFPLMVIVRGTRFASYVVKLTKSLVDITSLILERKERLVNKRIRMMEILC